MPLLTTIVDDGQDTSSPLGGMPWWVKAVAWVGFPGLIALILLNAQLAPKAKEVEEANTELRQLLNQHMVDMRQDEANRRQDQDRILLLLQGVCLNTAQSETGRTRCLVQR